ncbi:MFS transporter [Planosporangium sp. 12N6]|uniref:MFS transporter n=1 Tax=Planosporangium spinosum TaxID=3402278 RepID=UPI003CF1A795
MILSVLRRNRDFRRLVAAELVMFGGDWFVMVPLLVLLPRLTGSGLWGGLVLAVDTGIQALLLPFAGTVADRLDRRYIMVATNAAGVLAVLALLLVRTPGTAWVAPVAVAALAVAKAFYTPAASAALPNLVDANDLGAANAVAGSAWGTMTVVAASLGGVLAARVSPYACFVVTAVCLASATAVVWSIRRPMQAGTAPAPVRTFAAIGQALRYIRSRPQVAALVTVKSAVGLGNGVLTTFPLLATAVFAVGPAGTGVLFAARGLGVLIGPLLLRRVLAHRSWLMPGIALSMATYGAAYLAAAVTPWFWLVVVLVVVAHVGGGGNWAMTGFALQTQVPDALRGRVFATDVMIATIAVTVSQLSVSVSVDHVATRVLVACCGAVTLGYAVGWRLVTRRLLRRVGTPASSVL